MWIVRLALRRPYTFVVLAIVILLMTPIVLQRTPTDIFPNIDIPVVSTVWNYGGLSAPEMANRIVSGYERALTTTVNDIEHIESQSLAGVAVVKVFFQPHGEDRRGGRAGHRDRPDGAAADAAGHDAAAHHHLQRVERADPPARPLGPGHLGAAALRPRQQRHPHAARDRRGRRDPVPVRRQAAPDPGRHRPRRAPGPGTRAERRRQRDQRAEPDPADRHVQDRRLRIRDRDQQQPDDDPGAERPADPRGGRRGRLHPRRRAGPRRLSRRRPTSCASTASARRC